MADLEKEVESIIFDLIDSEDLKINDNDEIEYTQKWFNEWLMDWILDGYTTKEVMKIREYFENFEYEEQVEKSYQVGVITYDNGHQEAEWEDEIVDVTITTKKNSIGGIWNEIWSIRNGKWKQQKGFEGKGRKKIKEQN